MTPEEIKSKLDRIITIDGKGRSEKAKLLIDILNNSDILTLKETLEKFTNLKY